MKCSFGIITVDVLDFRGAMKINQVIADFVKNSRGTLSDVNTRERGVNAQEKSKRKTRWTRHQFSAILEEAPGRLDLFKSL